MCKGIEKHKFNLGHCASLRVEVLAGQAGRESRSAKGFHLSNSVAKLGTILGNHMRSSSCDEAIKRSDFEGVAKAIEGAVCKLVAETFFSRMTSILCQGESIMFKSVMFLYSRHEVIP